MVLALVEFFRMAERAGGSPQKVTGIATSLLFFISVFGYVNGWWPVSLAALTLLLLFVVFICELYRKHPTPIPNIAYTLGGFIYVAVPMALTNFIIFPGFPANSQFYPWILFGVTVTIWIFDSAAYLVGTSIGKHRLLERVSPKKSWEGEFGGGVFALLAGVCNAMLFPVLSITEWLVISAIVIVAGTWGDLVESLMKRSIDLKDSGDMLPGHGGFLDRLDSYLLSVPFVVAWLYIAGLQ
jgi:phosphatidate cytidylyltransferase